MIAKSLTPRRIALASVCASAALLAAPIAAETYLITLQNGTTIQSRYQPQESSWDAGMVLFMTETGNWIGMKKSDIASVEQENNLRGFGFVINPTTVALGWAPNDAADPAAAVEGDFAARLLQALSPAAPPAKENYSVQQGVSTEQTQGIPLDYVPGGQAYGGNPQQVVQPPSVVILPQATPGPATPATSAPNSDLTPRP
jgi:hypothetical protein